jgi:hypothetical protein
MSPVIDWLAPASSAPSMRTNPAVWRRLRGAGRTGGETTALRGVRAGAAWVILTLLLTVHAIETRTVVAHVAATNEAASASLRHVQEFIDAHAHEPDFSFATQRSSKLDPEIDLLEGYPDDPAAVVRRKRVSEILFRRYYDRDKPKYVPF